MENKHYVCIHGHFYQPPRENAWLEVVELQDSAQPFHDWNERINFECYAPNTAARILNEQGSISKIINNYAHISFNFGPTLLSWLEHADPATYQAIIEADVQSRKLFGGHGSAIAQVHSHLILPLANARDKETQVAWGIKDFEHRFGRKPEGMWLAETAVDTPTLEVLAEHGIQYTILSPRQGKAIRKIGTEHWQQLPHDSIDPRRAYRYNLPSGKSIALFFYDGEIAQGVAFKGLLNNGKEFARQMCSKFDGRAEPQLSHVATDGESYGHHHRHGEMALADCLNSIQNQQMATLTNYGQFLELVPLQYEVQIHENSSWSCVHGVERWRSDCGCNTGGHPHWNQLWRAPLRDALDWLRDELIPIFEKEAGKLLKDPWAARDDYIQILLDRGDEQLQVFIDQHAKKPLSPTQHNKLLRLMEMQRNAILMYTSCGWFFDEISGIETMQILQYALRAIDYARQVSKAELHEEFEKRLEKAPSNVYENGASSFRDHVIPSRVGLTRAGMHYAVSSLFEEKPEELPLFNYIAENEFLERSAAGNQKLAIGRTTVRSLITRSEKHFSFAVIYLGQQNIIGNISTDMKSAHFREMYDKIIKAFRNHDLGDVIGLMQAYFGSEKYTFRHLFRDEKRKILKMITNRNLKLAENSFRDIYNDNYQLMSEMLKSNIPVPKAYKNVVQFIVNADLHRFFEKGELSIEQLQSLARQLKKWGIQLGNEQSFKLAAGERIFYELRLMASNNIPLKQVELLIEILKTVDEMGLELDIWKSQNQYFSMMQGYKRGDWVFVNEEWKKTFLELGNLLKVKVIELAKVPAGGF
ncbi:MAG: DUF3536 domain-containing protein [Bacteroidota bacterium]